MSNLQDVQMKSLHCIALATMTYIVEPNSYELHQMDEWVLNDFINDKWICLAKSILAIFSTWSFWHIHIIGFIWFIFLYMYSRGLPSFIYVRISFLRGENLVYLGDLFHGHARTWFLVLTISAPPGPKKMISFKSCLFHKLKIYIVELLVIFLSASRLSPNFQPFGRNDIQRSIAYYFTFKKHLYIYLSWFFSLHSWS